MKKILISTLLIAQFSLVAVSQEPKFRNQGEQEDYQSVQFFKTEYKPARYEKYVGAISIIDGKTMEFGNKTLVIWGTKSDLLAIFKEGIFYPQLMIGNEENVRTKTKTELKSLNNQELFEYNVSRNDSLKISDLEELDFVEHTQTQKRFRFWFYRQGFANPQVYFFELTNDQANETTDLRTFIKGSKLTFLKGAWIII